MPIDINISDFTPKEGSAGTVITVSLGKGLSGNPGDFVPQGGMFTSDETGRRYVAESVQILDPQKYSSFSITVPSDMTEAGGYQFFILLTNNKNPGHSVKLESTILFKVAGGAPGGGVFINSVMPNQVTRDELARSGLRVTGTNLNQINAVRGGFFLVPYNRAFNVSSLTTRRAIIRMPGARTMPPEDYRLCGRTVMGTRVSSSAALKVLP